MERSRITFPVYSFHNLETPFSQQKHKDYYAVIKLADLPDLKGWRKINVRDAKLTGRVPEAIRRGAHDNPDLFVFMNRGIVIAVESVQFDNKASKVTIDLKDPRLHGLLDGGHTYDILCGERESLPDQYVKLEFLEGFLEDEIPNVVDARNTSNQVGDQSLMNLQGDFEPLRRALKGESFADKIAYKEFELDDNGEPKPIDVRDVIAILTVFDKDHFGTDNHPINAYRSKSACLQHFKNNKSSYMKLYPIAADILKLYDEVQLRLPDLYNSQGGKFGRLTGVSVYKRKKPVLEFVEKESEYGVPSGFIYPILGAFRALLEESKGEYRWGKGLDPVEVLANGLGKQLAQTIGNFALEMRNPSKTGKSIPVWQACYSMGEITYLKA